MDEIPASFIQLIIQGGALGLLALTLLGAGWLFWKIVIILREMQRTFTNELNKHRDKFEEMTTAQRQESIRALTTNRQEHLSELKLLRESLCQSLDHNTQATNMLTNALIAGGGTPRKT